MAAKKSSTPARKAAKAVAKTVKAIAKAPAKAAKKAASRGKGTPAGWQPYHTASPCWEKVDAELKDRLAKLSPHQETHQRVLAIHDRWLVEFPDAECALTHENAWQLLIATILSAQCTDERVNMVTPALFERFPTPELMAQADIEELEELVKSTGFFRNKAKAIKGASHDIVTRFGGQVPEAIEDLITLRGAARKTANVVRTNCFGFPGLTVDTHFQRISKRLGLTKQEDPEKIEAEVGSLLPPERWCHFTHAIILHGRKTCKARKPLCAECRVNDLCPSAFRAEE